MSQYFGAITQHAGIFMAAIDVDHLRRDPVVFEILRRNQGRKWDSPRSNLAGPSAVVPAHGRFPGYLDSRYSSNSNAALTHHIKPDTLEKIECAFGLYKRTFFCDPTVLYFSILEMRGARLSPAGIEPVQKTTRPHSEIQNAARCG